MGLLRLFLAFSVFSAHAYKPLGVQLVPAETAVHSFYVISGFYMALVLNERYLPQKATYFDFLGNRLLRLIPAYVVVAAATIVAGFLLHAANSSSIPPVDQLRALSLQGAPGELLAFLGLSHATLLLQDSFYYFTWTLANGFAFTRDFHQDSGTLSRFLLVPQAWSLSLELYFYCLAPFLVRRRISVLVAVVVAGLAVRLFLLAGLDLRTDPWSDRFFPSAISFFLTGVIAYRLHRAQDISMPIKLVSLGVLGAVLGVADTIGAWHTGIGLSAYLRTPFVAAVVMALPFLFDRTKSWRFDRYIGELSYPLYVSHVLVIWVLAAVAPGGDSMSKRWVLIAVALLSAVALHEFVESRVDRYRVARLSRRQSRDRGRFPLVGGVDTVGRIDR